MNPSQLPPKSPGSFGSFGVAGAMVVDSSTAAARSSLPASLRPVAAGSHHKRTPSTGFLPHTQPTWIDGVVEVPDDLFKRGAHRRMASESMAFLDGTNFSKMVDDNINEEDDYESRSVASLQSGGHSGAGSLDFDRLDEDQLMSMFGNNDDEPNQKQQQQQGSNKSRGDAERVRTFNKDVPSTPDSDSNSMSEVSNEDPKGGFGSGDHEAGTQAFSKGELQQALAGLDSTLDPKRAKRILANRQSAQRSRVRKLQYISELERSVTALQSEVSTMGPQVAFFEHRRALLNVDNNSIKHKMAALLQNQLFQDAHNEALQTEVQRLRRLYQQHQQHSQAGIPTSAYDLQQQGNSTTEATDSTFTTTTSDLSCTRGALPLHNNSLNNAVVASSTW